MRRHVTCICWALNILIAVILPFDGWCQWILEGNGDSLNSVPDVGKFLGKGILQGRYKKPGWREFIMPDRLELPAVLPATLPPHPRLLTHSQLQFGKMNSGQLPQRSWYFLLKQEADRPVQPFYPRVRPLAQQAKAAAIMYRTEEDPRYLEKAIALLQRLPEPPVIVDLEGGTADRDWGDYLQSAEPIPDICVAFDVLQDELPEPLRAEIARKVLGVAELLVEGLRLTPRNNHVTVMAIAVATCALTFDDIPRYLSFTPPELYGTAMEYLSLSLGLIAPDGGYAEGPYYARYILNYLAVFSVYLDNTLRIRLFDHPYLQRLVNWVMANDKGGGEFTQFDDAFTTRFFFLPLISTSQARENFWEEYWQHLPQEQMYSSNMAEALLVYSNPRSDLNYRIFFPGNFFPETGQVIFRNSIYQPSLFASMIYEQENQFADVHEQIDPLSLEISAYGEHFIRDGGYGRGTPDKNRPYFLSQKANSTILVDREGTDPNPLTGDELEGHLDFAFSTPHFAAAGITHQVGDVNISRTMFYSGTGRLLLLDRMEGNLPHNYTVQFNYTGNFSETPGGRLQWQGADVRLEAQMFYDRQKHWQLFQDRRLYTVGSSTPEINLLRIESGYHRNSELAMVWSASRGKEELRLLPLPLLVGEGDWRQAGNVTGSAVEDFVWNRSESVSTTRWRSDGRFCWVRHQMASLPEAFLLVNGTRFEYGGLKIVLNRPAILYLERQGDRWAGYIHFDPRPEPVKFAGEGIFIGPVRLQDGFPEYTTQGSQMHFTINTPGVISFGIGAPLVHLPQRYLEESGFLAGAARRTSLRGSSVYRSDYEAALFKNEVTRELLQAGDEVLKNWGTAGTGDSLIFHNGINVTQGLLQYGYRSSQDGRGIRLPHRHQLAGNVAGTRWEMQEEGDWRSRGMQIREWEMQILTARHLRLGYGIHRLFDDYQGYDFSADWNRQAGLQGGYSRTPEKNWQNYTAYVRRPGWSFQPSVLLEDHRTSRVKVDAGYRDFWGSAVADRLSDHPVYRELLGGRLGQNYQFIIEGTQFRDDPLQVYRASLSGALGRSHYFSGSGAMQKQDDWQLQDGNLSLGGRLQRASYLQNVFYAGSNYYWNSAFSYTWSSTLVSADIQTRNWQFGKYGQANLGFHHLFPNRIGWDTRWHYRFRGREYRLGVEQQWHVPVHNNLAIIPVWHAEVGGGLSTRAAGGGFWSRKPMPLNFEFIQYRNRPDFVYRTRGTIELPLSRMQRLMVSTTCLWTSETMLYSEIRVHQIGDGQMNPGMYYRYLYPEDQRLEGFLEWRW